LIAVLDRYTKKHIYSDKHTTGCIPCRIKIFTEFLSGYEYTRRSFHMESREQFWSTTSGYIFNGKVKSFENLRKCFRTV
jgi:hypothetical protein